ncbi:hypothetical protein BDN72DRAFT_446602 [Pluteus cervinus]|uniref:Uncharacterized protein n=1 Tax=Pluteus cervinus TaxID=181527 RepID=A0ACD3BC42_9AGAR|nr:hypothetical protein BDN72DRAFT_446602 [Pluteus cervinus]
MSESDSLASELRDLEQLVSSLQLREKDLLDQLRQTRSALEPLRSRVRLLKNSGAPILKLPTELLSAILVKAHAIEDRAGCPFEVRISHVCQRLRDVAISTSPIWTTFKICLWRWPPEFHRMYLERSRRMPLNATFHSHGKTPREVVARMTNLLDNIIIRVRSLSLIFDVDHFGYNLAKDYLCGIRAPHLEHFRVVAPGASLQPFFIISGAPVLKSLDLTSCMPTDLSLISKVTRLKLKVIPVLNLSSPICASLACFSRLTHLTLEGWIPTMVQTFITLPHLRILGIHCTGISEHLIRFPTILRTPALESLAFNGAVADGVVRFFNLLGSLPSNTFPKLRSVALFYSTLCPLEEPANLPWVEPRSSPHPFSTVERLSLVGFTGNDTESILAELYNGERYSPSLFPKLHTLALVDTTLDLSTLTSTLASRDALRQVASFRTVQLPQAELMRLRGTPAYEALERRARITSFDPSGLARFYGFAAPRR